MLDFFNIPNSQQDVQIFYTNGITNAWQTWKKPRKCNYVYIICIGGGGGGAGGRPISSAIPYSTGGGSGAVTRLTIPAIFLPDSLEITIPAGGNGGATGGGSTAGNTFVDCVRGSDVAATRVIQANGGVGGNVGVVGAPSIGGGGGTIGAQTNAVYQALGSWVSVAGQAGGNGIPGLAGGTVVINGNSTINSGGAAGGGRNGGAVGQSGGGLSGIGLIPSLNGGTGGTPGSPGQNGFFTMKNFYSLGGSGGGGGSTNGAGGVGGRGGDGGIGSGGGGGGNGYTSQAGAGGNGGPGMVIITCW